MFEPETEDMLPRAAPKPSAPLSQVKPIVPEVSILGQEATKTETQKPIMQSYAAWRKQVLPKVNCTIPTEATDCLTKTAGTVVYTRENSSDFNLHTQQHTLRNNVSPLSMPAASSVNRFQTNTSRDTPHYHRRSLTDSPPLFTMTLKDNDCVSDTATAEIGAKPTTVYENNNAFKQQQRRSLDITTQQRHTSVPVTMGEKQKKEVLTICATTQTDAMVPETVTHVLRNYATKQDVQQLLAMMHELREEQRHMSHLCEALLVQREKHLNQAKMTNVRDVGLQCDLHIISNGNYVRRSTPIVREYEQNNVEENNNNVQQHQQQQPTSTNNHNHNNNFYTNTNAVQADSLQQYQSPQPKPAAQSTAYRPNTPRYSPLPIYLQAQQQQLHLPLPTNVKPPTEKTMVMNELALKYLPNNQINEYIQDFQINLPQSPVGCTIPTTATTTTAPPPTNTPLCNIENVDKGPCELSNASYKYLKKYRLLPEEENQYQMQPDVDIKINFENNETAAATKHREVLVDFEHIRRQPKFL